MAKRASKMSEATSRKRPWTDNEVLQLKALGSKKLHCAEISRLLGTDTILDNPKGVLA
jgi:hypothetical protein